MTPLFRRLRITISGPAMARLASLASKAGWTIPGEAQLLLLLGMEIAERRWRNLEGTGRPGPTGVPRTNDEIMAEFDPTTKRQIAREYEDSYDDPRQRLERGGDSGTSDWREPDWGTYRPDPPL